MFPFDAFNSMFVLVFMLVIGTIAFTLISNIVRWSKNQASDVRMRNVRVVTKRTHVHGSGGHMSSHGHHGSSTRTTYYVTFEFLDDGQRAEFQLPDKQYGLLAEGDLGILNYQGTQFNAFELTRNEVIYK